VSRKSELKSALVAAMNRKGGAHLTREARERTASLFASSMIEAGYTHLVGPEDVAGKHLKAYVSLRKANGVGSRTLQNELSHLRSALRAAGRSAVADAPEQSNEALGISGGVRIGRKTAMPDADRESVVRRADELNRPGLGCLIDLERYLGLRGNEAIHARIDTLKRWRSELLRDGRISVIEGTKGGRRREVKIFGIEHALSAIDRAIAEAETSGGFLVLRADGSPAGGLKHARSIYHSWAFRSGIQPHAARYAFAQDQMAGYINSGYSAREALIAVSHDLGHGDGRGRWVKSVYMRP
jgi:integrase